MSVATHMEVRQSYQPTFRCPACDNGWSAAFGYEFRTSAYVRGSGKDKFEIQAMGAPSDPHLVITCQNCGFWWEMEVARP